MSDEKEKISIRLDTDVLEFFRKDGPRWQTRINDVLRDYMNGKGSDFFSKVSRD